MVGKFTDCLTVKPNQNQNSSVQMNNLSIGQSTYILYLLFILVTCLTQ